MSASLPPAAEFLAARLREWGEARRALEAATERLVAAFEGQRGAPGEAVERIMYAFITWQLQREGRPLDVQAIDATVTDHFMLPIFALRSRTKTAEYSGPRYIAMHLCRVLTPHTTQKIASCFKRDDHSIVNHAMQWVRNRADTEKDFAAELVTLRAKAIDALAKLESPLFPPVS